jgi:XTP/dITP diphosphohydrolase
VSAGRLVLLTTTSRVAPGLLSWQAWSVLRSAAVFSGSPDHPLLPYLDDAGVAVHVEPPSGERDPHALAGHLVTLARERGEVVWLSDPHGDPGLDSALAALLVESADAPEVEVLPGAYDLPGAAVLDLVAVMDRLRSPGGCPWDAEQTHESLMTYLVEETYETLEAIETGDRRHLREELGDLLLQVAFHSRIAQEHPEEPWAIDDVAQDIVAKLVRRHPHVFGSAGAVTAQDVENNWETLKASEKGRSSAIEGVPMALPALTLAAKIIGRVEKSGLAVHVPVQDAGSGLGSRLLALVAEAREAGLDPEAELRAAVRRYADRVYEAERAAGRSARPG